MTKRKATEYENTKAALDKALLVVAKAEKAYYRSEAVLAKAVKAYNEAKAVHNKVKIQSGH